MFQHLQTKGHISMPLNFKHSKRLISPPITLPTTTTLSPPLISLSPHSSPLLPPTPPPLLLPPHHRGQREQKSSWTGLTTTTTKPSLLNSSSSTTTTRYLRITPPPTFSFSHSSFLPLLLIFSFLFLTLLSPSFQTPSFFLTPPHPSFILRSLLPLTHPPSSRSTAPMSNASSTAPNKSSTSSTRCPNPS